METEELGSVYESLLELVPLINLDARIFSFQTDGSSRKGNERKTSGGYYTPDSLVQLLLNEALDPVLDSIESCSPSDPVAEFLKLSVIDPASGVRSFFVGRSTANCRSDCPIPIT